MTSPERYGSFAMKQFLHSERRREGSKYCLNFASILVAAGLASELFVKLNPLLRLALGIILLGFILLGLLMTPQKDGGK